MADLTGQILGGRYRVETILGRGGMSEVYKVFDVQRAVYLAMKVLNADLIKDQAFMQRFIQEAQTLEKLQHPNIVRFYGLVKTGGHSFILMDYINGLTLRNEIGLLKKAMTPTRILEILQPVCAALYYAHQMGMVHCDIKPANIMIHSNHTVYLADFGIAQITASAEKTSTTVGTPAYVAPECLSGQSPTPASDIYSLGVVLYEMLTGGKRPFTGESAKTTGSITKKIIWEKQHTAAPSPRKYNSEITPTLEAITQRCLERNPKRRFSSMLDLLEALQVAISGQGEDDEIRTQVDLPVQPVAKKPRKSRAEKLASDHPMEMPAPAKEPSVPPAQAKHARRMGLWVLAATAMLLIAAIALWGLNSPQKNLGNTPAALMQLSQVAAQTQNPSNEPSPTKMATSAPTQGSPENISTEPAAGNTPAAEAILTAQATPMGGSHQIAFASNRGGSVQIWTTDASDPSDRPAQVTDLPNGACQPAWSPDGTQLAFTTPCKGPSVYYPSATIKIVDLKDRSISDLLPKSQGAFDPAWSPDGKTIAYTAIVGEETEIRAIEIGAEQSRVLAARGTKNAQPAWSRDGKYIAFISSDDRYRDALWLMRADGSSQELLAHDGALSEPTWTSDDRMIMLSAVKGGMPNLAIFDRNNPTLGVVPLLKNTYRMSHSSISPDTRWAVFWSEDDRGTPYIMLVNFDSKLAAPLFNSTSRDFQPAWSPQ